MFKYKIDKYSWLQKCKTRLVIYRNQQKWHDLLTRTITLGITFLYILLALINKFNLKMIQFDNVNIFVYINIDKTIFRHMLARYSKNSKVLHLNKVFYGLWQFFLLW